MTESPAASALVQPFGRWPYESFVRSHTAPFAQCQLVVLWQAKPSYSLQVPWSSVSRWQSPLHDVGVPPSIFAVPGPGNG